MLILLEILPGTTAPQEGICIFHQLNLIQVGILAHLICHGGEIDPVALESSQ